MDRSLRRLGQLLVVMGALLGAVLGVALALIVENGEPPRAVAMVGPERAAVFAAHPPSSQPPAPRAASSEGQADDRASSGSPPAVSAEQRRGTAHKHGEGRREKPSRGNDKPGKHKHK